MAEDKQLHIKQPKSAQRAASTFAVIVIGAGHAGLEAAFITAKMGLKTLLFVLDEKYVAACPCSPSIGGPAKGIVTREVDALGGMQGLATDACALQFRMLNESKGPAVQALRAQIDKQQYHAWFLKEIKRQKNLQLGVGEVTRIVLNDQGAVCGVEVDQKHFYGAQAVVLTAGTYLRALVHQGTNQKETGPAGAKTARALALQLEKEFGLQLMRLKTGTPPRIARDSINYDELKEEAGSPRPLAFSLRTKKFLAVDQQRLCWSLHTNEKTHALVRKHLNESPMYSGQIKSRGPRYCPSIEDKICRFADRERHQLFLEPEASNSQQMYLAGFSTSFPITVQDALLRTLPGLKDCRVTAYGYAIEYDAIDPTQLYPTLEVKQIPGLFCAGQINGTSGYEEAAGQGLMAGINAALKIKGEPPLVLRRDEAYIGVMIDDLTTRGTTEPYRLLTSRAEHRLLLRHDNVAARLYPHARRIKTLDEQTDKAFCDSQQRIKNALAWLNKKKTGEFAPLRALTPNTNFSLARYLRRPEVDVNELWQVLGKDAPELDAAERMAIVIDIRYAGYIEAAQRTVRAAASLDEFVLPTTFDYGQVLNLAKEAAARLNTIQPLNLGQAARVSGVNFGDLIAIKAHFAQTKRDVKKTGKKPVSKQSSKKTSPATAVSPHKRS